MNIDAVSLFEYLDLNPERKPAVLDELLQYLPTDTITEFVHDCVEDEILEYFGDYSEED